MITLLCPRCGQGLDVASSSIAPPTCPRCGAPLPHEVTPPTGTDRPDTVQAPDSPTLVGAVPVTYPFLDPPRGPNEIGWLGAYRVLRVLGAGGMGIVFHAEDTALDRPVALKVMNPDVARDPIARKRFLREARLTAAVHSDHVVTVHQVGVAHELPYLATELLEGETLAGWMQKGEKPSPARIIDVGLQMAQGLAAAHEKGLIHRDIKPANVWLEAGGRVKILDFGLARPVENSGGLTQVGIVMGTPAYMAPEQAEGKPVDARSDLFSLGCVLYEFATSQQPFTGPTPFAVLTATILRDPRPPREVNPDLPVEVSALIMQLLAKRPEDRPASAAAIVEALETLAADHPLPRVKLGSGPRPRIPPGLPAPAPPPPPRHRLPYLLAGLAVLLLGGVAAAWLLGFLPGERGKRSASRPVVQGVSDDEVVLGMSAPFSGPAGELGRDLQTGILTCFHHVNDRGGVAGRKLRLVALDDGYEPDRALANVRELDERYKVLGFVGNVGTPTAEKTLPYALKRKMLFFGPFTGAHLLRKSPPDRYVFNYRPSLEEETGAATRYLLDVQKLRPEQIAVFAQEDGYGDSGFRGVARQLDKRGRAREQILRVGYRRNTLAVEAAAQEIIKHREVRGVVLVPTYRPAAKFIRLVKDQRRDVLFTSTSFVDAAALAEELRQLGPRYPDGVVVTQMVPPVDSEASAIIDFRERLRKYFPSETPNPVSLEGYVTAQLLIEGLRRAGDHLTTDSLIDALESIRDLDLGIGVKLGFSPSEHQASRKVWAIILDERGRPRPLDLD